jgi:hypothetical protein
MIMAIVLTFAMSVFIVLWAIGTKAIDAFLLVALVMLVAAMVKVLAAHMPTRR